MDLVDPPSFRAIVRTILGVAATVAAVALVIVSVASGHIEWKLASLVLVLWAARSFFEAVSSAVVEPLGRFVEAALTGGTMPADTGGTMPADTGLSIDLETGSLERLLATDPPPPAHRVILAGIRLAEIYRTHQHDAAKADALVARLAALYPDAPELTYVRPPRSQSVAPGGATPLGDAGIPIEQETGSLERLLAADPLPPTHRVILAGIRLAEIYRTHQHDAAKADALITRLVTQYPDAPELQYVRPQRTD